MADVIRIEEYIMATVKNDCKPMLEESVMEVCGQPLFVALSRNACDLMSSGRNAKCFPSDKLGYFAERLRDSYIDALCVYFDKADHPKITRWVMLNTTGKQRMPKPKTASETIAKLKQECAMVMDRVAFLQRWHNNVITLPDLRAFIDQIGPLTNAVHRSTTQGKVAIPICEYVPGTSIRIYVESLVATRRNSQGDVWVPINRFVPLSLMEHNTYTLTEQMEGDDTHVAVITFSITKEGMLGYTARLNPRSASAGETIINRKYTCRSASMRVAPNITPF